MINILLKLVKNTGLVKILAEEIHLNKWTHILFIKKSTINYQVLNLKFLIYSIIYFLNWNKFLVSNSLFIWFILEQNDILFIQKLISENFFNFIVNTAWIPGILSNSYFIMGGYRYQKAIENKQIKITNWIQIAFFCTLENSAIVQEMNYSLIPSIVPFTNILHSNYYNSVPVFLPKYNKYYISNINNTTFNCNTFIKKKFKQIYFKDNYISKNLYIYNSISQKLWFFYIFLLSFSFTNK